MKKVILLLTIVSVTGCAVAIPAPWSEGFVMTTGDKLGIEADADHDAALISEGKATPDTKGSYYQMREMSIKGLTFGKTKGGTNG